MANEQDSETQLSGLFRVRLPGAVYLICDAKIRCDNVISKRLDSER
jgi:hypothetical protein